MTKENTTKLDKKVRELFSQLPKDYQTAVKEINTHELMEKIAEEHNLDDTELVELDREVTYLLLRVQTSAKFMLRLEDKLGWSEEKVADITKSVTKKIIRPLEKKLNKKENEDRTPVPKPPSASDKPPTPNYGGGSDPYREPPE